MDGDGDGSGGDRMVLLQSDSFGEHVVPRHMVANATSQHNFDCVAQLGTLGAATSTSATTASVHTAQHWHPQLHELHCADRLLADVPVMLLRSAKYSRRWVSTGCTWRGCISSARTQHACPATFATTSSGR